MIELFMNQIFVIVTSSDKSPCFGYDLLQQMMFEYQVLSQYSEQSFSWKSIWKQKIPSRVAFFVWTAALGKCLTIDNLRKRKVYILDWCYMCKCNSVNHLFLHCPVASELWDMVFGLFGVNWIVPLSVVGLFAYWQGHFGRLCNGVIWKIVPSCLMWCIWKERNNRCFEDSERAMPDLKLLFLKTLLDWFSVWRNHPLSILDLLDFCNFRSWLFSLVYSLCAWMSFSFNEWILITYQKKKSFIPVYKCFICLFKFVEQFEGHAVCFSALLYYYYLIYYKNKCITRNFFIL